MHRKFALVGAALVAVACRDPHSPSEPTATAQARAEGGAGDKYIVVFRSDVADVPGLARRLTAAHGGELRFTYQHAIKGFAARVPAAAAAALARNPQVAYVDVDAPAELFATTTQSNATWGLDRVDQVDLPLDKSYDYAATGAGVNAYVFDTGINPNHLDFGGRVSFVDNGSGGNFVPDGRADATDCHGHGTHVAGTIGGNTWGVAKGVKLWAARVVNCQGGGDVSYAIAAVDWIAARAAQVRPAVVNMSLGYGNVQSLRDAVETAIAGGINFAVSAGNGNFFGVPQDACLQSPGGAPNANTVGATTSADAESSFSNYGRCVDLLAPGSSITSADYRSTTGSVSMSGTSMSSPHVAGAIALYLEGAPAAPPSVVSTALKQTAVPNTISLHSSSRNNGTANLLLNAYRLAAGAAANRAPRASFTYSCSRTSCTFTDRSTDPDANVASRGWSFGDGTTASPGAATQSHTYSGVGTYTVTLTVTDAAGLTGVSAQAVTVKKRR